MSNDTSKTTQPVKTMTEFARASGLSRPTVSKYFHDPESVKAKTRAKIERAIEEHDYRPNLYAINLNRKSTKNVGIIVPLLADPFFVELARRLEALCIEAGYRPVLYSAHGDAESEGSALESLRSLKPAGALIAPLGVSSDLEAIDRFANDIPTVLFDSSLELNSPFVGSDNFQSIGLIVEYLCRTGEPPCFFEMPPVNPNATTRRTAFTKTMERLGFEPQVVHVAKSSWEFERVGFEEGKRLITENKLPSNTVLCSNDRIAIGLLAAAYERGLRVGRGEGCAMRIAGHDDHPWARFACPPLTTIAQDYDGIAERSVSILLSLIESQDRGHAQDPVKLEGRLVMRASA